MTRRAAVIAKGSAYLEDVATFERSMGTISSQDTICGMGRGRCTATETLVSRTVVQEAL